MPPQILESVPEETVHEIVHSLITRDGATEITLTKNPDGTWRVEGR